MKILVLTFYYPPDLGAGSFRSAAFVKALSKELAGSGELHVITTRPNRYQSFNSEAPEFEEHDGLKVRRISILQHKSGMTDQVRAFAAFAFGVLKSIRNEHYDIVFATSGRMFTGTLGAYSARKLGTSLYLDIRDIFNDAISGILNRTISRIMMPVLNNVERYTISSALGINLVSEGFRDYFERRYPGKTFSFIPNGVDEEFLDRDSAAGRVKSNPPYTVLYAGNIGQGQGLHLILPNLAKLAGETFNFLVIGDGGTRKLLEQALANECVANVRLLPPVSRQDLFSYYEKADVLFLHLNKQPAFRKVLPSKIFEYAALGKPILAGVEGYPAEFLRHNVKNIAIFPPCDAAGGVEALKSVRMELTDRHDFILQFRREMLMKQLAQDVINKVQTARADTTLSRN